MHYDNEFELILEVVFGMSPQLGGLGPKKQDLVIPLHLGEGELLSYYHLIALAIMIELVLTRDQKGQMNNLTGKNIMELSKMKHLQRYMTSFDLEFRRFERQPQSNQFSSIITHTMEESFETI